MKEFQIDDFVVADVKGHHSLQRIAGRVSFIANKIITVTADWVIEHYENVDDGFSQYSEKHHSFDNRVTVDVNNVKLLHRDHQLI